MAYLDWINKKEVVKHHQIVPLHLFLKDGKNIGLDVNQSMNIRGDNLSLLLNN